MTSKVPTDASVPTAYDPTKAEFPARTIDICLLHAYDTGISNRGDACVRPWISMRNSFVNLWT
ncbi:hypothetical protein COMA2_110100 [Candidatus Nitrospira nitrificans]|uniref:Uncharacterized protein n=1 Tax=Candidatus Nitrospira nitrificans TaxID=1742973 RepID=A0A0S4L5J8_9BACT|nr:hypothetical protein COMA2_110100 [Candidatus Nitrospira nitrificans]